MSDFLPTQPPGPGPTDAPLPTYQSYSAYVTSTYDYATTITRVAYDPQGTLAPSLNIETQNGKTTSIGYSVVNIPLLYDGPLPPPPLGTLYTTANQRIAPAPTNQPSNGNGSGNGSSGGSSGTGSQGSGQGSNNGGAGNGSNNGGQNGSGGSNSNGSNNGQGNGSNNGGTSGSNNGQGSGTNNGGTNGAGSNSGGTNNGGTNGSGSNSGTNNGQGSNGAGTGSGGGNSNGQNGGTNNGSNQAGGQGANNGSGSAGNGSGSNDGGSGNGSGSNGNGGGADNGNGGNTGAGGSGGSSTGTGSSPTVTNAPPNATNDPAALSSSASAASVAASNAASSASAASVAASNAAESSSASLASVSAASQASSASVESVSANSLSATPSGTSSTSQPTDSNTSNGGFPTANTPNSNFAKNGLSGGQIAGIVIGVLAAVLLALLLCLCCARRRRRKQNEEAAALTGGAMPFGRRMKRRVSDRWANGWSRGGAGSQGGPGTYSALGAGAGAAALGAGGAAAGGRGSLRSDEWEEDHLDGGDGSGFFVVGGNRTGSQNPFSHEDDDEMHQYGNAAPSSNNKSGLGKAAGLAGLGAGIAAAFGAGKRRRSSGKGKEADHAPLPTSQDEADLAEHNTNQQDNDAERHGLMQNVDADMTADMTGDASEMQQAGPSGWTRTSIPSQSNPASPSSYSKAGLGTAAALGAGAAGAYYAGKHRGGKDDQSGDEMSSVAGAAPVSTASNAQRSSVTGLTESGVASAYGSGSGSGTNPSSNSTGQRTSNSTFTGYSHGSPALHPPPSAPRGERQMYTFGNVPPRHSGADQQGRPDRIPSFTGGFGDGDMGMFGHRSAADSYQGMDDNERNLAYAAAAAAAAAGGGAGLSALASHHRDSNQGTPYLGANGQEGGNDERYSRFISRDTPLLGPGATHADVTQKTDGDVSGGDPSTLGRSDSLGRHGRLPTIQSVGEFGERSNDAPASTMNQSSHSGTNTTRSGYGSGGKGQGSTFYSPALPQTSQSMNSLGAVTADEGFDESQDPFSNDAAVGQRADHNDEETAAGALAGAGLLGSLASGWRKLTGNTPSQPSSSGGRGAEGSGGDTTTENAETSGNASMQRGISRDSNADVYHREPQAQRVIGDPDMAAEVQSQRASVQQANGSNLGHGNGLASPVIRSGEGRSPSSSAKSGNGSGGSGGETRPHTLAEEPEEDAEGETASPYVDDGNDADDEDAVGDRSKAPLIAGAGALAAGAVAKGKQSSQAKSSSDDPYDHASNTNESSMLAVRNPTEEPDSRPSMDTGLSRAATTGTYSSSMQTHSQSQPSEESSSRRTQQSSSGASTGAASYSPSYLARHPSGSTRGGGAGSSSMSSRGTRGGGASSRRQGTNDESEYTSSSGQQRRETSTLDSGDGRSSMATAGEVADEGYRSNRERGPLARVQEDEDASGYDLGEGNEGVLPTTSYYPSESLGAAVRRRAEQEARQEAQQHGSGESDQTGTSPQQQLSSISTTPRAIPLSLRPGGNPAESSQWRQSPRVDAVSQRAARNAASLERQHQRSQSGSGSTAAATSPRQEAGDGQRAQQEGEVGEDETDEGNSRTTWPKFLRF
ncbi:uncharacterized protein FA14DRAFT_182052 [Meira miltonrushii]|uniref:Uncharacterized protein n=1 Tax=Meira miltonrushii TaxID=1280837 RepID=A0A316V542_9BASI|nr:uncharacterized protein FA14DRAFT_182052 [Meira miltonrushii]PWN32138.1 hypothetical protein FA14DRAFT_182052 [Meira miltonrushii]